MPAQRTPRSTAWTTTTREATLGPADPHRKLLSSLRLKVLLSLFVGLLVLGLSALVFVSVSRIFSRLTPLMREDLVWKAQRGALELAQTADLAIAVKDSALVEKAIGDYSSSGHVLAIVATTTGGQLLALYGALPEPVPRLFQGAERAVRSEPGYLVSWASAAIEGNNVGKVAVVISTERLAEGERLRTQLLVVSGLGCLLALGVSLFFVNFYLVPLVTLSQRGLRTAREMEIAKRIQTSILPMHVRVPGVQFSAAMVPAAEVGGDYYDIIPVKRGCWIGIGDVAGHGVKAGLIMMMLQSIVSSLVRRREDVPLGEVLEVLNQVLFENIRHRLRSDEHVTFCLLRLHGDGRLSYAGAHEELLVLRAATGKVERLETPGTWLGAVPVVKAAGMPVQENRLAPGDVLVLYTDGVTEATNTSKQQFGIDRLVAEVERHRAASADEIRARIMDAVARWTAVQNDDISVVVLRYMGG
jgi:hypothetical protein